MSTDPRGEPRPDLDEAEHPMDLDEALAWLRFAAQGQRVDPTDRDVARAVLAALADAQAEIARLRAEVIEQADEVARQTHVVVSEGQREALEGIARELRALAAAPAPAEDEAHDVWWRVRHVGTNDLFGTFDRREHAEECAARLREAGHNVDVQAPAPAREQADPADEEILPRIGPPGPERLDDGHGGLWEKCNRGPACGLQIVRPGKVQCWCDNEADR